MPFVDNKNNGIIRSIRRELVPQPAVLEQLGHCDSVVGVLLQRMGDEFPRLWRHFLGECEVTLNEGKSTFMMLFIVYCRLM